MEALNERIVRFLKKHHILTLATCAEGQPWCCTCFYVFDDENVRFIFTSDKETRHITEGLNNTAVAGTIALETRIIGKLRGVQFAGTLTEMSGSNFDAARKTYLKRFPYAAPFIGSTSFWSIDVTLLKMTDNRLGFGKKIFWYMST